MKTATRFQAACRSPRFYMAIMPWGSLLLAGLLTSHNFAFGQSGIRALSVACQTSTGSAAAAESLSRLKALATDTPELPQAITACQARFEELQKQETSQWTMAVTARDRLDCQTAKRLFQELFQKRTAYQRQARDELNQLGNCVPSGQGRTTEAVPSNAEALNTLRQARGAFNTRNFVVARSLAQSIASRTDQTGEEAKSLIRSIDSIELNNKRHRDALFAITLKQFEKACQLLKEIETSDPSFGGLADAKARAGGCPVAEVVVDRFKAQYEEAVRLLEAAQYSESRGILQRIRAENSNYRDTAGLLAKAETAIKNEKQKNVDQRVAELKSSVEDLIRQGELSAANGKLLTALKLQPDRESLRELEARLRKALSAEEESLLSGIDAYYAGKYAQVRQILGLYIQAKHSPKLLALACFYLGAAAVGEYYLTGATDQSKKREGMLFFTQALKHYPNFSPEWSALSPKIKGVFAEARGR